MRVLHAPRGAPRLATVRTVAMLRAALAEWRRAGATIGLVPTMGAVHAGHLALIERARAECERVVATLFVNPIQFNEKADLEAYPIDEAADAVRFAEAGVDLLFAPTVEEMYPQGFTTKVAVAELTGCLCGLARPGHLDGVATVVAKLFNQARADSAYFGEKDYQQLLVVRQMARDLDIPVRIVGLPTVRESDGLALSSRNIYLTPGQRRAAPELYRSLRALAGRLAAGAEAGPELARGREALLQAGFDPIDYLDLRHGETLAPLERAAPPARLFVAAWLGGIRLIDNLPAG